MRTKLDIEARVANQHESDGSSAMTMSKAKWIALFVMLAVAIFVAMKLRRFLQVDACLDGGGCWVHGEERCEESDQEACTQSGLEVDSR